MALGTLERPRVGAPELDEENAEVREDAEDATASGELRPRNREERRSRRQARRAVALATPEQAEQRAGAPELDKENPEVCEDAEDEAASGEL